MKENNRDHWPDILDWRQGVREHLKDARHEDEGLRERKKRLMRQQISDTATSMFLDRGFDDVRITEIAAACNVSEKTIYNYFANKEALILDREEEMASEIRRTLGPGAAKISPVVATVEVLKSQMDDLFSHWEGSERQDMTMIRRFVDLIEQTPALRTAQVDMMDRLAQIAAESMAARAGVDPEDPEPQIAANALVGLWRIFSRAIVKYSSEKTTPSAVRAAVLDEVERAARLIDTGLWSFGMAVQGANGREQIRVATEASNEARRQVVTAIKEARTAWHQMKQEIHQQVHDERDSYRTAQNKRAQQMKEAAQTKKREAQQARQKIRQEFRKGPAR
ncbi:MAG: TetR/AcrR family transcriptional regulator [Acidimicrobiales bacterium]